MIHFDLPKQKSSIIKVLGVGGGGSNAVNFMFSQNIEGVDFIICNTDAKAIEQSAVPNKIQLGPHLTQGLGAGANPEVGKKATEESLEEIRRILEVNTKMAFITVGMGGGTGTGGAPIIAQICKDLGILTVGIVTTPFGFEGPRRKQQAEEGINALKPYVDTLLVISNEKLRMQYGNLKMKEAFSKADNVLATAAKCITDVINSRGHIIVDFADVCTVMKNGGVAILGKAEVEGENRAQRAIEEALSSPLLNDDDIRGAKWILININSAEGEHECTMDELETINNHLRMQAGEDTDVIVGMGYDPTLDKKIGITMVATGFERKDPFAKPMAAPVVEAVPEKIVMTLGLETVDAKPIAPVVQIAPTLVEEVAAREALLPTLQEEAYTPVVALQPVIVEEVIIDHAAEERESLVLQFELNTDITEEVVLPTVAEAPPAMSAGILNKPTNIYAEAVAAPIVAEVTPVFDMQLVEKTEEPTPAPAPQAAAFEEETLFDDVEEQKKRAAERIQKLRNLSYNMNNSADPNGEFDAVPAYVRRNMELFGNTLTSVENFYSKYTVGKDDQNPGNISTINKFFDGKKPD